MAAAAAGGGGGSDSNGWPVRPHEQGMFKAKVKKRSTQPRDRAESGSPVSAVTTCTATPAASSGGGDNGVEVQQQTNGKRPRTPAASSGGAGDGVAAVQQQTNGKRPRLVWTTELHERFVRACRSLGRVVPKKILEAMKVSGLTRENVASHLQKYRKNLQGRGQQASRRRGSTDGGNGTVTMQHVPAPSLQPAAFPQAQPPVASASFQAPPPPPSAVNPPPTPPQGPFAAAPNNMPRPQMGQVQLVQALPALVHHHPHQPRPDFPPVLVPAPVRRQLFYQPPQFQQAAMQHRHRILMEQQARHAARMNMQGHDHRMAARIHELGAQALSAGATAAAAAGGVPSHRMEPFIQASQAVSMGGGLCLVPEAAMRDEQTEARMAHVQIAVEAGGGQVPAAEPAAFAGSADPGGGGQQEDSCDVLQFWNTDSAPSMDHEFPPNKPI